MLMPEIKNIIFDLGNVIHNINPELTQKAFHELGYSHFNIYSLKKEDKILLDGFETGKVSAADFRKHIRSLICPDLTDVAIDDAWNALLLDLPAERLELLKELKKKYRLFLLSNTNELHIEWVFNYLQKTYGISGLSGYFEKEYYSHLVGMRKPQAEIYERILSENGLTAEETLFIDDSEENIEGARKLKIHAYHLTSGETILNINFNYISSIF